MIISGKNSVYEALVAGRTINKVMLDSAKMDDYSKKIVELCKRGHVRFDFVQRKILDKVADHHQGVVAEITDFCYCDVDEILASKKPQGSFIVILDGVQDPHNFGSIIRVCECAGVDGIIIESRRSCAVNETVFKTSCGAINHMRIAKVGNINDQIKKLKEKDIWVFCAEADGEDIYNAKLTGNIALVMGSEGFGVGALTRKLCDGTLSLPMFGKVNSLNVSTATSAMVYEVVRQRQLGTR